MARHDDNERSAPREAAEVLASAATLVGLARAPGRRGLVQAARLACVPFLFRGRPNAASASGPAEGAPLQWALLPLASLLPWLSLIAADTPQAGSAATSTATPTIDAAAATRRADRDDAPARRSAGAPDDDALALAPLPLRAPSRRSPVEPAVLPLRSQAATPASGSAAGPSVTPARNPAVAAQELAGGPVWPAPGGTARPGFDAPTPALTAMEAAAPAPRPPAAGEYRWELPLVARSRPSAAPASFAAPVAAPAAELPSLLSLPARRPFTPAAEPDAAPPPSSDRMPTLHAKAPAMHVDFSQVVAQVVRQVRTEVTQTVVAEVQRAAVKLAQANPPPRPSEVLAELYTDQSIRKLLARMRRVEQEERRRGGLI